MDVMESMQGVSRTTVEAKAVSELEGAVSYLDTRLTELRAKVSALRDRVDPLMSQRDIMLASGEKIGDDIDTRSEHVRKLSEFARHASETTDIVESMLARLEV